MVDFAAEVSGIPDLAAAIALVAAFASLLVLSIFRRRVQRSLAGKQTSGAGTHHSGPAVASSAPRAEGESSERELLAAPNPKISLPVSSWHALSAEASRHRRSLAKLYVVGGLVLAIAFATVSTIAGADHSQAPFLGFLYSAICFSGPLILTVRLVYGRWKPRLPLIALAVVLLAILTQTLPVGTEQTDPAIVSTGLLALLLHPRIRAMGPLALGFFTLVIVGAGVAILRTLHLTQEGIRADVQAIIGKSPTNLDQLVQALPSNLLPIFLPILQRAAVGAAVGLPVSILLGGLLFFLVTRSYARKRTSDQWLVIASVWLFFAVAVAPQNLPGLAWNLASATAFVLVVRSGWTRLPRYEGPCVRLLLLRSFTLGERSNRLFQELETLWRGVGSIQLVGAPDLALITLEPHELLDFIRGRSGRYFVHSQPDVDRTLASFDYARDPDGRFRVNVIFCGGDATWQYAVHRLLAESHCILMDVRGFTRYRAGCVFEIRCLAESAVRSPVVFLVDEVTDRSFIGEIWANATKASSVEACGETATLRFVSEQHGDGGVGQRIIAAFSNPEIGGNAHGEHRC